MENHLTKKEKYFLKKQQKEQEHLRKERKRKIKRVAFISLPILLIVGGGIFALMNYFPKEEGIGTPKIEMNPSEYDVGTVCSPSPHRMFIINKLRENGIKINHIRSKYGLDRDKEICKCKIFLNLHYVKESNILESIRCYPILFSKLVLISE